MNDSPQQKAPGLRPVEYVRVICSGGVSVETRMMCWALEHIHTPYNVSNAQQIQYLVQFTVLHRAATQGLK